jgi:ribonuclease BN (tRNA processing enzyme)
MHLEAVFSQQHNAPYFPVPLAAIRAEMNFHELIEGASFELGNAKITCARLNHPWVAIAYRVEVDRAAVVYCSDTAPFTDILLGQMFVERPSFGTLPPIVKDELAAMRAGVVALARDADLLIYDTQFTPAEYQLRPHWGHSRPDDAIEIAREANVKQLCLFHHAPLRSDEENDQILARYREVVAQANDKFTLVSAYEGLEIPLGDST